jgi:hypothetical protein
MWGCARIRVQSYFSRPMTVNARSGKSFKVFTDNWRSICSDETRKLKTWNLAGWHRATLVATLVAVVPIGDGAVQVIYKTPEGTIKDRLLGRADEANISIATIERPWAFDGNGEDFKLAVEAKRIDLAFLFDPMMAIHTSNVDALPHQITAVYESMLPRQPLRFVLADDPGSGKTIMAGLYMRELIMRADARRIW